MSVQLYPVSRTGEFSSSWFSWRPVWNVACDLLPELSRKAGNSNDYYYVPAATFLKAVRRITPAQLQEWCRANNYTAVMKDSEWTEFLDELKAWLANSDGFVVG